MHQSNLLIKSTYNPRLQNYIPNRLSPTKDIDNILDVLKIQEQGKSYVFACCLFFTHPRLNSFGPN